MPALPEAIAGLPNAAQIPPSLVAGDQPAERHPVRLRAAECRPICDLREPSERGAFGETETVKELGLEYVNVPVTPHTINETTREGAGRLRYAHGGRGRFPHCASGNRARATLLRHLTRERDLGAEDALTLATRAGLSRRDLLPVPHPRDPSRLAAPPVPVHPHLADLPAAGLAEDGAPHLDPLPGPAAPEDQLEFGREPRPRTVDLA